MAYVRVGSKGEVDEKNVLKVRGKDDADPAEISDKAWKKLEQMLVHYGNEMNGYQSQRMPQKVYYGGPGDYDHLARTQEWRTADGEDDG